MKSRILCFLAVSIVFVPLALAQGTYTQIDYPGAVSTKCYGINTNGDIVGTYSINNVDYGFILSGGIYTTVAYPGTGKNTYLTGINDTGQVVGSTYTSSSGFGFVYDIETQIFTNIRIPGADVTYQLAINNAGIIAGDADLLGFERDESGHKRTIAVPGASATQPQGITASGVVVGYFTQQGVLRNFLFSRGEYRRLAIPNATDAAVLGTNPAGTAFVGACCKTNVGFLYQNKTLQKLAFPGAKETFAYGVNAAGEVTGMFFGSDGNFHGFSWTPPGATKK